MILVGEVAGLQQQTLIFVSASLYFSPALLELLSSLPRAACAAAPVAAALAGVPLVPVAAVLSATPLPAAAAAAAGAVAAAVAAAEATHPRETSVRSELRQCC